MSDLDRKTADSEVFEQYRLFHQFVRGQLHRMDFVAVRIVGWNGEGGAEIYEHFPDDRGQDWDCTDPADADVFCQGDVKFDGEMNLDFPNAAKCMIQFGNVADATSIGRLLARIYAIAVDRIPSADRQYFFRDSGNSARGMC